MDSSSNLSNIKDSMKQNFVTYLVVSMIILFVVLTILYIIYLTKLQDKECNYMDNMYGTLDGNIKSLSLTDADLSGNFNEYYIKSAYNACSGGSYKNDFVNICNLKAVLKQGVRGLDFEIYSIDNQPVVATSTSDNYYIKETYNSVNFSEVMSTIKNYAFSQSTAPNPSDPIIIHLRFMSNNQQMYTNLANIFQSSDDIMLGKEYSFENSGHNIGDEKLLNFMKKIILIVDRSNTAFVENKELLEFVNMTSGSMFMRGFNYFDVKNSPDLEELREYNKRNLTIVFPDHGSDPPNPSGILCRDAGCQLVAMRYQYVDNFLVENALFFDRCGYAFCLKPERLRYKLITIPDPIPQDLALSYETRDVSSDFYSFSI
jgi:hypothetical protein